jgi:receptor protein-tyrosine kinase
MIARFGQTKREQVAHAVRHLEDVGAPLLAAIFTMTPARRNASYSYNYTYGGDPGAASGSTEATPPKHGRRAPDRQNAQTRSE